MRLFVAVLPPPSVTGPLAAALRDVPRGDLRWVAPAQWHVTLRFLGEVDGADDVGRALRSIPRALRAAGDAAVVAALGPATAWMADGRVLQVPVAGLDALAAAVDQAVAPWAAPADHPFRGHLTLARSRGRSGARSRSRSGHGAGVAVAATWRVRHVVLMASEPGAAGAVHRDVRRVGLRAGAPWHLPGRRT